nr:MAG TPA: hypothetical protein [Caudoviricetes sp.]
MKSPTLCFLNGDRRKPPCLINLLLLSTASICTTGI